VLAENEANNGSTSLLAKLLLKGTKTRTAVKIATEIESVGGHIDSYGGNQSYCVNAEVMSSDFAPPRLVADVLLNRFSPRTNWIREREVQLAGIQSRRDDLLKSGVSPCGAGFRCHHLRPRPSGSETSVSKVSVADLRSFHLRLTVPTTA